MRLPIEEIVFGAPPGSLPAPRRLGGSREGRAVEGYVLGRGELQVSLIAGCHADEPVGPKLLRGLVAYLAAARRDQALLTEVRWHIVPHANPDGEARNARWSDRTLAVVDHRGDADRGYDLAAYSQHVVREAPGDDVEFGFPRSPADDAARPENRAVAAFLRQAGPLHLHGSFHGMSFAPGPWFLIEPSWVERTGSLRDALRRRVGELGYRLFDIDRRGEKGFRRIDEGFSTRPDSGAMAAFFRARGDDETAALFRPSSMELARSLGSDPFTLVSEMPLFLLPEHTPDTPFPEPVGTAGRLAFHAWLTALVDDDPVNAASRAAALGIRPMPIRDQMRLQLAFLEAGLRAVMT